MTPLEALALLAELKKPDEGMTAFLNDVPRRPPLAPRTAD